MFKIMLLYVNMYQGNSISFLRDRIDDCVHCQPICITNVFNTYEYPYAQYFEY
jgi:hypothetical protein